MLIKELVFVVFGPIRALRLALREHPFLGFTIIGVAAGVFTAFGGHVNAQSSSTLHLGSPVIMMGYEDPSLYGAKRAAIVTEGPFVCPKTFRDPAISAALLSHPHAGGECVTLTYFVRSPGDFENADPVQCVAPAGCGGMDLSNYGVRSGSDRRIAVWHDPTGKEHRSFHEWGEMEGEE